MQPVHHILAAIVTMLFAGPAEADFDDPMTFHEATNGGNCVTCNWIIAEGVIEIDTVEEFLAFLDHKNLLDVRGLNIHFNSPGGSLIGGVLLGHAIREQEANTVVSAAHVETIYEDGLRKVSYKPNIAAECSSSCVFAFAGGVSRFASETTPGAAIGFQEIGRIGVHQFYEATALSNPSEAILNAEDRISDQKIISILLGFLSEMDVSAELLQLASMTDPRDMHYLDEDELRRSRIDNRMVRDVFLTGYRNGVAVAEVTYQRRDGDYRLEIYCDDDAMYMLTSIDWRGNYDIDGHRQWNLFDGVSLTDGGALKLVSEEFFRRTDGGVSSQLRFQFTDPLNKLTMRKTFAFEDWSSRYANNSASSMSFTLPSKFDGLWLLPRTCM